MDPQPPDPTSPHSTWEERRAWLLFASAKFPSYERFWQTFVVPRTKHAKYYTTDLNILPDVPSLERRIVDLNYYRIFCQLYFVYRSLEKKQGTPSRERYDFRASLWRLSAACEATDLLLFFLLLITQELPEDHPIHQAYLQRVADHKAKVKAARAPYEGRTQFCDSEFPPRIPFTDLLPSEYATTREHLNLTNFDNLAGQIRRYKEAVDTLRASNPKYWHKDYDKHIAPKIAAEDKAAEQATQLSRSSSPTIPACVISPKS